MFPIGDDSPTGVAASHASHHLSGGRIVLVEIRLDPADAVNKGYWRMTKSRRRDRMKLQSVPILEQFDLPNPSVVCGNEIR